MGRSWLLSFARRPKSEQLAILASLTPGRRLRLEAGLGLRVWAPNPGPQERAYLSGADELFYGGAAGGGKTDLMLGLALTAHQNTLFLRRLAVDLKAAARRLKAVAGKAGAWAGSGYGGTMRLPGRVVEMAGCEHEEDRQKYQGQDHDLKLFDELSHFSRSQYQFIIGWNRSADPAQRCRVVAGGNPPTTPEGRWVVEEWAPWLEKGHPDPARPGELRWYTVLDEKTVWLKTPDPVVHKGERITPRSRTFIPAVLGDNPFLDRTDYRSVVQAMPEPLRSQMLYGDFTAGTKDNAFQVIPTAWVQAAMDRWRPEGRNGRDLSAVGVDVACGGPAKTVLAPRYGTWWGPLRKYPGAETPDGRTVAALVAPLLVEGPEALVVVDSIGYGAAAYEACGLRGWNAIGCRFGAATAATDRSGVMTFVNIRAWAYWALRELLDPANGHDVQIHPDPELLADLCAPRWRPAAGGAQIERKEDIEKRLGRSPDCGDAVVYSIIVSE